MRWDEIDPAEMIEFMTLEPIAMSDPQTITRAADDVNFIAKRLKEIEAERTTARDPGNAWGEELDNVGRIWGLDRTSGESDYAFKERIKQKARGE